MLRKLAIAIAASGAMMSASTTYALGMGDIVLDSALNQPLDARIKLLKANELEDWEIKPDLASREEFDKSGVERVFFLNSFKFEVERTESGVYVNISSEQPVVEPFLNFLVQVDWPSGRLLREYTLLLDPPVFTEEEPAQIAPAAQTDAYDSEGSDYVSEETEYASDESLPGTGVYEESEPEDQVFDQTESEPEQESKPKTYAVRKNDTLWEVAIKTRADRSVTPQQAMLAIQDLNPDAFINGNINRLKKNQVLRVPSKDEMLSRSFSEAVSEVAMQNQAVAKRKAQLDATRKDEAMVRDDSAADARLKLLAGGDATTEANRGASGKVLAKTAGDQSSLENDLNLALENLDKSKLENQELRTRLDSLEDQINTLQRLINLKDEQMVALQTGMAVENTPAVEEKPVKVVEEPVKAEGDLNFAETAKEDDAVPADEAKADMPAKSTTEENKLASKEPVAGEAKAEAPKAKPKPKPKFVYTPPEEEPFDVVAFAIENPQIPGAVIGALLLALLGVSRARKRKEAAHDEEVSGSQFEGQDPLDAVEADLEDDFHSEFDDLQASEPENDFDGADFDTGDLDEVATADAGLPDSLDDADLGEGQDVLGEVDVYMAYNRVEPAKELLEKTLLQQPGRTELRVKLLEVLAEMDDQETFSEHFDYVSANGNQAEIAQAESIKSRLGLSEGSDLSDDLGLDLDMSSNSDDLGLAVDESEGELDFDLDGLDLSSDLEASSEQESVETGHDSTLDFDMDLSDFETESAASDVDLDLDVPELGAADDSSLDAGLDLGSLDDSDDFTSLDFNTESSDLDLGSDSDASLDLGGLSLDSESDAGSLDIDDGLSFETADLGAELEEVSELDVPELDTEMPSLDVSESSTDALDLDLDEGVDIPSLDAELSLDSDLAELSEDLDDELAGLSQDMGSEIESGLDLDEGLELDSSLDLDEELELDTGLDLETGLDADTSDANQLADDSASHESEDLVDLDGDDDLPPLGDLDLDNLDEDLDFLSGTDESETKLDLARAYIDMDDKDGAKEILQEVLEEGSDQQKQDASKLMDSMA